jgi:hypothetical protein
VVSEDARQTAPIVERQSASKEAEARPGQWVGVALGGVEQQRDTRIEGDVAAVLGKVGEQQERARIEIDREQYE